MTPTQMCLFCPHVAHGTVKCSVLTCGCKGKPKWWQKTLAGLGDVIGEALFGGNR